MLEKQEIQKLYDAALKVRLNSYSPYSKFKVGAALLLQDGNIITGTNVENASYGLSMCAERNAIFEAVIKGYRKEDFVKLCLITDSKSIASPCGACRQVISEFFSKDTPIILATTSGERLITNIGELLPYSFDEENLK